MRVTNWEKWQSYRSDRGTPPWIKVHRNLHSNSEWAEMTDSEKGQLLSIWLLAADKSGSFPDDSTLIQKMCMMDNAPDLNRFKELGFIEEGGCQGDVKAASTEGQDDVPEESRVDQSRVEGQTRFDTFWSMYPNKIKKKPAKSAFLNLTNTDQQALLDHLPLRVADSGFQQYTPHPTTFINQRRWEDENWQRVNNTPTRDLTDREVLKLAQKAKLSTAGKSRSELLDKIGYQR